MGRPKLPLSGVPGIYAIVNTINNHRYIGSATGIRQRLNHHRRALDLDCHHSIYLGRAWRKYGSDAFRFEVLEICQSSDNQLLAEREQHYIDTLKPEYNMMNKARRAPELTKEEYLAAADKSAADFIVTLPDGTEKEIHNMARFCRENGLDERYMSAVSRGRQYQHRGYRIRRKNNPFPPYQHRTGPMRRLVKNGKIYEFNNVKEFCKQQGISTTYVYSLFKGDIDNAKGFTRHE